MKTYLTCSVPLLFAIVLCFTNQVLAQNYWKSPCPRLFVYESVNRTGSWDGIFNLVSRKSLGGVWFRLEFDRPILKLETGFGEEVVPKTDSLFLIKAPKVPLPAHKAIPVFFTVQYAEANGPPKLIAAYLNAVKICPEIEEAPLMPPMKHVAYGVNPPDKPPAGNLGPTAPPPAADPPRWMKTRAPTQSPLVTIPPGQDLAVQSQEEDDDLYLGDFEIIQRAEPTELEKQCGTIAVDVKPLISHGQPAQEGEFPWHAAVYKLKTNQYLCGGSLISDYFVVTAGHCVAKKNQNQAANPRQLFVQLGKHYYNVLKASMNIQGSRVSEVMLHPEYSPANYNNDIAMLKLTEPAILTNFVRPVCLWEGDDDLVFVEYQIGSICGWGYDEVQKNTAALMQANLLVVSDNECRGSNKVLDENLGPKEFCAGFRNGTSACRGDSGGGMVFPIYGNDNRWVLRGIISTSLGLIYQKRTTCDSNNYMIFTDAAKFSPWMRSIVKRRYSK